MCKLDTEKSDSMLSWSSGHWEAAGPVLNSNSEIGLRELQKKFDYKDILLWCYLIFSLMIFYCGKIYVTQFTILIIFKYII